MADVRVSGAVEGLVDEAVALRLIALIGATAGPVYGKTGKSRLRQGIPRYNAAARHTRWLVLIDLDQDDECAPRYRDNLLESISPRMCLRVVVRAVEAWLLADRESVARFLAIAQALIPARPESLNDPKECMVNLARRSRRRDIREDMVPRPGSGRNIGPAYPARLIEYVQRHWRPEVAAECSDSLCRTLKCLGRLIQI